MIDLLALPLIIESMYLVHNFEKIDRQGTQSFKSPFFGDVDRFQTHYSRDCNLSVLAIKVAKAREALGTAPLMLALVALVAPLVPFSLFITRKQLVQFSILQ